MREYVIGTGVINGYRITKPIKVKSFQMESGFTSGFHLEYRFESLRDGQCMGVVGKNYREAKQFMKEALVDLHKTLAEHESSSDDQIRVNALAKAELDGFLAPVQIK